MGTKEIAERNRRLAPFAGAFILPTLLLVFPGLVPTDPAATFAGYLVAIGIASACAFIGLVRFHAQRNTPILFIGLAYVGKTALFLAYCLILPGFIVDTQTASHDDLLFWSAYFSGVYLSTLLLLSQVRWPRRPVGELKIRIAMVYVFGIIAIPILYLALYYLRLPELGWNLGPLKTPYALIPAALFASALFLLLRAGGWLTSAPQRWLAFALALKAGSFLFLLGTSERPLDSAWHSWQMMLAISDAILLTGLLRSMFDIYKRSEIQTKRMAVQAASLKESEGFSRAVLAHAPMGIVTATGDGFVLNTNPVADRAFGTPDSANRRTDIREFFSEGALAELEAMSRASAKTGEPQVLRKLARGERFDGRDFPVSLTVVSYQSGATSLLAAFVRDLTEVLRQEERTQATLSLQQAVLDNAPAMIVTADPAGVVTSFNREATLATGFTAEEVLDRELMVFRERAADGGEGSFRSIISRARETGVDLRTCLAEKKGGGTFEVELSITALREQDGAASGYLLLATDITKKREAERVKSEFISTVSHELRTPLTSIRGALGLFTQSDPKLSTQEANLIQIAHRNVERLILLINDLLDMDKLEAGKMSFKLDRCELGPLVDAAATAAEGQAIARSIKIAKDAGSEGVWVHLDSSRFMQVMSNLLSNAIKFSPHGGTIDMRVVAGEKLARIEITDHGDGIPKEKQKFLFQKFFQADSSDRRSHGGTGLGLSICKMIVERLGGKISFVSKPGETTFIVELPSVAAPMATSPDSKALRVLVVEDDPDASAILGRILSEAGYSVDSAADARAAKALLKRGRYDCITLDMLLPDQDGTAFLADIRKTPAGRDIPVITVSVVDPGEAAAHAVMAVSDWQTKPIAPDRLVNAVKRAIEAQPGLKVLHVEDDVDTAELVAHVLKGIAPVTHKPTFASAKEAIEGEQFALVLLDILLPDGSGYDLLPLLSEKHPATPVIILSSKDDHGIAAEKVAAVLSKTSVSSEDLVGSIRNALGGGKRPDADGKPVRGPHERFLVVEDDKTAARLLELLLHDLARIDVAGTLAQARSAVKEHAYSLVLLDLGLPDGDGRDLLPLLNSLHPDTPVMILTGREGDDSKEWGSIPVLNKNQTSDDDLLSTVKQTLDAWRANDNA